MRREFLLPFLAVLAIGFCDGQQIFPIPIVPIPNATPLHKAGDGVTPPALLYTPEPEYSKYAKKKRIQGVCLVGMIVDAEGIPQNVHIVKSLEPSLDQNAIEAVKKYRFRPAMKDGKTPVPVVVNIEVNFRLY